MAVTVGALAAVAVAAAVVPRVLIDSHAQPLHLSSVIVDLSSSTRDDDLAFAAGDVEAVFDASPAAVFVDVIRNDTVSTVWRGEIDCDSSNSLECRKELDAARGAAVSALADQLDAPRAGNSDFLGALRSVENHLHAVADDAVVEVLVVGDALQHSTELDLSRLETTGDLERSLALAHDLGPADCTGWEVTFTGVEAPGPTLTTAQVDLVKQFWHELVRGCNGSVAAWDQVL